MLPRALLYDGPGYPYAIEGHGRVHGTLLVAAPGIYGELLGLLDHLEEFLGPGHPRNLYERVVREVELPAAGGPGRRGARAGLGLPRRGRRHPLAADRRRPHPRGAVDHGTRGGHSLAPVVGLTRPEHVADAPRSSPSGD